MHSLQHIRRRYQFEFVVALGSYLLVLWASISLLGRYRETAWRYPLVLAPVLPAVGMLFAVLRYLRGIDELERRIQLEALAFAFGASAIATFAYGFLEGAGWPHLNWTFVWPVMGTFWIAGVVLARRRYR